MATGVLAFRDFFTFSRIEGLVFRVADLAAEAHLVYLGVLDEGCIELRTPAEFRRRLADTQR